MPQISVIVPVYKVEKYIHRCVDSILGQTFTDFELILVDDGSPDNSGVICDEYADRDGRVKVVHQKNCGVSMARNAGLDVAVGKYILFVDSDDYISADYVAQLCSQYSDLTVCGLEAEDERGNGLYVLKHAEVLYKRHDEIEYTELYRNNVLYSPYCKLFLNRIIQCYGLRFPPDVSWGEDGMFVADYLQYVESMAVIEYVGYHYVRYDIEDSLSTKVREDVVEMIDRSRTYCIDKMLSTSTKHFADVKIVCMEDAKWNIVCFIRKLFESTALDKTGKTKVLKKYMENRYVADILSNVNFYFAGNTVYQVALKKNNASAIVESYLFEIRKQRIREWLYRIYEILPESVKAVYRYAKYRVSQ